MAGAPKKLKEMDGYYSVGYTPSKQSKSSNEKFVLWPAPAQPEGIYARLSGVRFSSTAEYLARMDELEDEFRSKHEAAQALVHPDKRQPWAPLMDRKFDKHSSHSPSEDDIPNATMFSFLQETSGMSCSGMACSACLGEKSKKEAMFSMGETLPRKLNKVKIKPSNLNLHVAKVHKELALVASTHSGKSAMKQQTCSAFLAKGSQDKKKEIMGIIKREAVIFQVTAGLSDRAIETPDFSRLISSVMNACGVDTKEGLQVVTRTDHAQIRENLLDGLVQSTQHKLHRARKYMESGLSDEALARTGSKDKNRSFVAIGHDGYDTKRRKAYGASAFWIDPETWELQSIALGVRSSESGKSEAEAQLASDILARWGIDSIDISSSITDTANAALKASRILMAGGVEFQSDAEASKCDMHQCQLAMKYAMGIDTRSGEPSFPAGKDLFNKMVALVGWFNNGKHKGRYAHYERLVKEKHSDWNTLKFPKFCTTRVAFVHTVMVSLLRSYYALRTFGEANHDETGFDTNLLLSDKEWSLLAQFEAVIRNLALCTFGVQSNSTTAGISLLVLINIVHCMDRVKSYWVIPIASKGVIWPPSTSHEAILEKYGVEMYGLKLGSDVAMGDCDNGSAESAFKELDPCAQELAVRVVDEIDRYKLNNPDRSELLSIALNPITWSRSKWFTRKEPALWKKCKAALCEEFVLEQAAMKKPKVHAPTVSQTDSQKPRTKKFRAGPDSDYDCSDDEGPELFSGATFASSAASMMSELEKWRILLVDWSEEARRQTGKEHKFYKEKPLEIAEVVSPLLWWKENASKWPIMHRLALRALARPSSNAFQERIFSGATFVDTLLRQRASEDTYEGNVVLRMNHPHLTRKPYETSEAAYQLRRQGWVTCDFKCARKAVEIEIKEAESKKRKRGGEDDVVVLD